MDNSGETKALFIVVNAGFADDVMDVARETGVASATIFSARGKGHHNEMFMGITTDAEKEIVLSITDEETSEKAMALIKEKAGVKTPAGGICFTMPVDQAVGISVHAPSSEKQ